MYKNILIILFSIFIIQSMNAQSSNISKDLQSNIVSQINAGDIIGIVVGTTADGKTAYLSKGKRSEEGAVNEKSIFEIGSISKTFTGLMLAEMVTQGEVKLTDKIQQYLGDEVKIPKHGGKEIQLFHLSNHTSGLPRLPANLSPADNLNPYQDYSAKNLYEFLNNHKLTKEIGSTYEYSNLGAGLLGHILAKLNKSTYEELLTRIITKPLGMNNTGLSLEADNFAKGHFAGKEVPNWEFDVLAGAGAIQSSAEDMMIYLKANMGLIECQLFPAMNLSHKISGSKESKPKVGLGWHVMNYDDKEIIWHNGGTGGYTSFMGWIKGTDKGVVVLNNSTENVDYIGLNALVSSYPLKKIKPIVDLAENVLEQYIGRYELAPGFILSVSKDGKQLSAMATGQSSLPIYPEAEDKFFYKLVDAKLEFQKNDNGIIQSVTLLQAGQQIIGKKLD